MLRPPRKRAFVAALAGAIVLVAGAVTLPAAFADDTGAITGHLTDGGDPVPNASVIAYDTTFGFAASTRTDEAGAFQFPALTAGGYKLQFFVNSYSQWSGQKTSFDEADVVMVVAGESTVVTEAIRPYGLISGHVTNPDGSPAANVSVNASSDSGFNFATTDSTGFYTLRYLPSGQYRVSFRQSGNSPIQYANNRTTFATADLIPVTTGATTTLDQVFLPFAIVTGTITDNGQPIAGVQVTIEAVDHSNAFSSSTDGAGQYRIPVWPGTYRVQVNRNGLWQYVPGQLSAESAQQFVVPAGTTVIDEQLLATGTITGVLTHADGSAVPFTQVAISGSRGTQFAFTDFEGRYTLPAYPGQYRIQFLTSYGSQWEDGRSSAAQADLVTVVAGSSTTADETLAPFGSVVVTAVDGVTGDPIDDFCVQADFGFACTDNGTVTDTDALPGRYQVWVQPQDGTHLDTPGTVEVTSGATATLTVPVVRGASVSTRMVDRRTGAAVENACIQLVDVTDPKGLGNHPGWCSDASGQVQGTRVRAGTYKVFVWAHDGVHGHQWVGPAGGVGQFKKARTITIAAGQALTLPVVRLDRAGTIAGTVTDEATGQPVTAGSVGLSSHDYGFGGGENVVAIDAQGRYSMPNLGPYQWSLFFSGTGYAEEWMGDEANRDRADQVKVRVGRTTTYDTTVGLGTTVTGQVFAPDGTLAVSARIEFVDAKSAENAGVGDFFAGAGPTYTAQVKGPQRVKLRFHSELYGQPYVGWIGGSGFADATVFRIPDTPTYVFDVTLPAPAN